MRVETQTTESSSTFYLIGMPDGRFASTTGSTYDISRARHVRDFEAAMLEQYPAGCKLLGCQVLTTRLYTLAYPE